MFFRIVFITCPLQLIGVQKMETLKLVRLEWISAERDKYIWEDLYSCSWDEIIGRMYLLKAHSAIEETRHKDALTDFEQALVLLAGEDVKKEYYYRALADKALAQCFLGRYDGPIDLLDDPCVFFACLSGSPSQTGRQAASEQRL
jgi:hypothetical protein